MKKLMLVLFITSALFGQNLLQNPGFEDWLQNSQGQDSIPVAWKDSINGTLPGYQLKNVEGYTGRALQFNYGDNPSGWDAMIMQYVDISSIPTTDTILMAVKVKYFGTGNMKARVWVSQYRSDMSFITGTSAGPSTYTDSSSSEWQESYYKFFRHPEATYARFEVRLYKTPSSFRGMDSIILDDAYLGRWISSISESEKSDIKISAVVNSFITFQFNHLGESDVHLSLYDATGRFMKDLYRGKVATGTLSFDVSHLGKGIYFVFVESAAEKKVYRFVKL